ncbi:MAG: Crp/Fnr family transcriptional regulator [Bacillota bacterium]
MTKISAEILTGFHLFRGIASTALQPYLPFFTRQRFSRRESISFEPGTSDAVFFVRYGRVKISYFSEDGKEFTVMILGPGEMYSRHSQAFVTALEETEVWIISMENFLQILQLDSQLPLRTIRILGRILHETNTAIQNLAFREVTARLALFILRQAGTHGKKVAKGLMVPLELTHEDMANLIGSRRQTITSTLNRFHQQGLITLSRGHLIVHDVERLQDLANS